MSFRWHGGVWRRPGWLSASSSSRAISRAIALPAGADLAWVSAIVHQNSRAQNRALFAKVFAALAPGGRIAIRDILMEEDRTRPVAGALFAVNMLVATEGGGTFTFAELREDLEAAGFARGCLGAPGRGDERHRRREEAWRGVSGLTYPFAGTGERQRTTALRAAPLLWACDLPFGER